MNGEMDVKTSLENSEFPLQKSIGWVSNSSRYLSEKLLHL